MSGFPVFFRMPKVKTEGYIDRLTSPLRLGRPERDPICRLPKGLPSEDCIRPILPASILGQCCERVP